MGGAVLVGALVATEVAKTGMDIYGDEKAKSAQEQEAEARNNAIKLQEDRAQYAASTDQIDRARKETQILSQQKALAASHGLSLESGSFGSLVAGSEAAYAEDNKKANISLQMTKDNLQAQIDQNNIALAAQEKQDNWNIFSSAVGGVADIAGTMSGGFGAKSPKKTTNNPYTEVAQTAGGQAADYDDQIAGGIADSGYYS